MIRVYPITPVPAPRQTRRDKFAATSRYPVRPPVARFRAYCDELKIRAVQIPETFHHVVFVLGCPASWSARQKAAHEGMPHRAKPDRDNLEKALLDGLFGDDAHVWDGRTTKLWGARSMLIVSDKTIPIITPFDLGSFYEALTWSAARRVAIDNARI